MFRKLTISSLSVLCLLALTIGAAAAPNPNSHKNAIHWPKNQALPSFAKVTQLDVTDVYDAPGDIKLLMATLQGIVNRAEPRIYLLENKEEGKMTWLNDLEVPYQVHDDYWDIVQKYKEEVRGIIIYDPNVLDSINVATTLAGLRDSVVVSPQLADKLEGAPYNFPVIEDLRGKFENRIDAYNWQYDNLWSQTTRRMLIGLSPGTSIRIPPGLPASFEKIAEEPTQERGANNRSVYEYDLSHFLGEESVYLRFQDAFTEDGWGPAVHRVTVSADGVVIADFVAGTSAEEPFLYDRQNSQVSAGQGGHRFADNNRYFVYRFTPPADTEQLTVSIDMWNQFKIYAGNIQPLSSEQKEPYGYLRDYAVANKAMVFWLESNVPEEKALFEKILSDVEPGTPYLGWFSNDVEGEFSGVEITSNHSVYVIAADWFSNLTVFSGTKQTPSPAKKREAPPLENKIYVTYTFGEGDNFQYNQHRLRVIWDDPNRGQVPINWTSSPLLYDGAPAILNYFQTTATENDLLVAGPSGAGYFYPDPWPEETFEEFLKRSRLYLKKTGMTIPYVLNRVDGHNIPLSDSRTAAYAKQFQAPGLFLSWENRFGTEIWNDTLPISIIRGVGSVNEANNVLANAKANWDGNSPLFLSLGILAWNLTPTDIVTITNALGPEYEVVLADQYFDLMRQAHQLVPASEMLDFDDLSEADE